MVNSMGPFEIDELFLGAKNRNRHGRRLRR